MKPKLTRACASAFSHLLALMIAAQLLAAATARADDFQGATHLMPFDEDTIAYSKTKAQGSIPTLQEKIDGGQVKLKFDPQFGYLPAVLAALGVPKSSQGLVFPRPRFSANASRPAIRARFISMMTPTSAMSLVRRCSSFPSLIPSWARSFTRWNRRTSPSRASRATTSVSNVTPRPRRWAYSVM